MRVLRRLAFGNSASIANGLERLRKAICENPKSSASWVNAERPVRGKLAGSVPVRGTDGVGRVAAVALSVVSANIIRAARRMAVDVVEGG